MCKQRTISENYNHMESVREKKGKRKGGDTTKQNLNLKKNKERKKKRQHIFQSYFILDAELRICEVLKEKGQPLIRVVV